MLIGEKSAVHTALHLFLVGAKATAEERETQEKQDDQE